MPWFTHKTDTDTTAPAAVTPAQPVTPPTPPSPVAPFQPNEVVFMVDASSIMTTIVPARVQDKVLSRSGFSYLYIVETAKGRIQASSSDLLTVATVQIALDQLPAFQGEPDISLANPDK